MTNKNIKLIEELDELVETLKNYHPRYHVKSDDELIQIALELLKVRNLKAIDKQLNSIDVSLNYIN